MTAVPNINEIKAQTAGSEPDYNAKSQLFFRRLREDAALECNENIRKAAMLGQAKCECSQYLPGEYVGALRYAGYAVKSIDVHDDGDGGRMSSVDVIEDNHHIVSWK